MHWGRAVAEEAREHGFLGRYFARFCLSSEGRYHTKWLNMMYPRRYLARNLMSEDGVIFISIDDNELSNLCKLCDEISGRRTSSYSASRKRTAKSDVPFGVSQDFEWIVVYAKAGFEAGFFIKRKYHFDDYDEGWRIADLTKQTTAQNAKLFSQWSIRDRREYPANPNRRVYYCGYFQEYMVRKDSLPW